jgi:uncharacterized protein (DUF58 family)
MTEPPRKLPTRTAESRKVVDPDRAGAPLGRQLPIAARVIVEGALTGLHKSARTARLKVGRVCRAPRSTRPGDELRHVDWKAYGKLDRYHVKQFEQETQLTAYLVVDASASMAFDGGGARKLDYAAWLAAALAYLVIGQQDQVGLVTFGDGEPRAIPARGRPSHLQELLAALTDVVARGASGRGSAASALERVQELTRRRKALVVLLSDLFDPDDRVLPTLRRLRASKHDVAVLQPLAPHERTFPYEGLTHFHALESDHRLLANPAAIRAGYLERMAAFLGRCRDELGQAGVDLVQPTTDQPLDEVLRELLAQRRGGAPATAAAGAEHGDAR